MCFAIDSPDSLDNVQERVQLSRHMDDGMTVKPFAVDLAGNVPLARTAHHLRHMQERTEEGPHGRG